MAKTLGMDEKKDGAASLICWRSIALATSKLAWRARLLLRSLFTLILPPFLLYQLPALQTKAQKDPAMFYLHIRLPSVSSILSNFVKIASKGCFAINS